MNANRYRFLAEELRTKAEEFSPENREMLFNMAEHYDKMAQWLEGRDTRSIEMPPHRPSADPLN